ncbi:MAG: hypothetical protein ACE5JS_06090 [Nitrospinota bacterium]
MAIEANVVEDFAAFTRMKKGQEPEQHDFKKGDKVSLLRAWKGELCLIKHPEGRVFNIKKTYLNKEVFEKGADEDKGKTRRKKSGQVPDYAAISAIRPELEMERGLAPELGKAVERSLEAGLSSFFRSKTGAAITAVIVLLAIYLGWQNFQKGRNRSPSGQLAAAILERGSLHERGHFQASYRSLKFRVDGSEVEGKVRDSIWGQRVLTLKVPGKKTAVLANEQEDRWLNNRQLRSLYFDEFVDVGSDGKVEKVIRVLEFKSDTDRFVAAYRKTIAPDEGHERLYRQNVRRILKALPNGR